MSDSNAVVAFAPDVGSIYVLKEDKTENRWIISNILRNANATYMTLLFVKGSDRYIVGGQHDGIISVWDIETSTRIFKHSGLHHQLPIFNMRWIDDNIFISAGGDRRLRLWNIDIGRIVNITTNSLTQNFENDGEAITELGYDTIADHCCSRVLAVRCDKEHVASSYGFNFNKVAIWRVVLNTEAGTFGQTYNITLLQVLTENISQGGSSLDYSKNGQFLASCCSRNIIFNIYEITNNNNYILKRRVEGDLVCLHRISNIFFIDNRYCLLDNSGKWSLLDIETGEKREITNEESHATRCTVLSNNGRFILTKSISNTVPRRQCINIYEKDHVDVEQLFGDLKNAASTS
jgi:WD40 repeat protein